MTDEQLSRKFDDWLRDDSGVAALVMRQWLEPVEGKDAVIFPPTYAKPERMREDDWTGYNIDQFEDGTSVCQIDSVGSQANRMEPIFKRETHKHLVPQIVIKAGGKEVNLLDAGHRAADAIVRFSNLTDELEKAFQSIKDGNAEPLAKIAPTSIVFGSWDSRATQVKIPRMVRSVIRAYQVRSLHRSAQYIPPLEYVDEGLLEQAQDKKQQDAMSQLGLSHAPAPWTHGGIQVTGEIRRDATVNLVAVRTLGAGTQDDEAVLKLRRYILGLSLVAFTAPQESFLREGCQLVPDGGKKAEWKKVHHDGKRDPVVLSPDDAKAYADAAATAFVVGKNSQQIEFSAEIASEALGQDKKQRKASRREKRSASVAPSGND